MTRILKLNTLESLSWNPFQASEVVISNP
jgi:hypothetical protein